MILREDAYKDLYAESRLNVRRTEDFLETLLIYETDHGINNGLDNFGGLALITFTEKHG